MNCPKCFPGDYWDPPSMCGDCEAEIEAAAESELDRRREDAMIEQREKSEGRD